MKGAPTLLIPAVADPPRVPDTVRASAYGLPMTRLVLIERQMTRFLREPVSVRGAARVIALATAVIVVVSGVVMRLVDHHEYPNIFRGMWWALQTVTTVGYGDVTPSHLSGRIVAAFVMFEGIALIAIVTAAVTSSFVGRAMRANQESIADTEAEYQHRTDDRLDALAADLAEIKALLQSLTNQPRQ
jgi:voltage-gated potassium channel